MNSRDLDTIRDVVRKIILWGAVLLALWGAWYLYDSIYDPKGPTIIIIKP